METLERIIKAIAAWFAAGNTLSKFAAFAGLCVGVLGLGVIAVCFWASRFADVAVFGWVAIAVWLLAVPAWVTFLKSLLRK